MSATTAATTSGVYFTYTDGDTIERSARNLPNDSTLWWSHVDPQTGNLETPQQVITHEAASGHPLEDEPLNKIYLVTDANGQITDRSFTSARTGVVDDETGRTPFQWSANLDSVDLAWWSPAPETEWTVSRDGHEIARTTDTNFRDTDVNRSTSSIYTVVATQEESETNDGEPKQYNYGVEVPPKEDSVIGLHIADELVTEPTHNSDITVSDDTISPMATRDTELSYGAFIADKRINRPDVCQPDKYEQFAGDDRTFTSDKKGDFEDLSYRLQNIAFIRWDGTKPILDETRTSVGDTIAYIDDEEVARARDDGSGLETTMYPGNTPGIANVKFVIAGSDPLCSVGGLIPAPDIDANVTVSLTNTSGALHIVGTHDGAPSHEALYNHITPSGDFLQGCLYRFAQGGFHKLLPPRDVGVDITMNPTGQWNVSCPIYEED